MLTSVNWMRESADTTLPGWLSDGVVYLDHMTLSAVSDCRRVCVVMCPYIVSATPVVCSMFS